MKKLSLLAGALCFVFVACCNKTTEPKQEEATEKTCEQKEHKCCKDMTEEQKAECKEFCEKWKDFDNQSEDVQKELVLKAKAKIDEYEAKMAAQKADFEAKWANFSNLPVDEQKTLIEMKMNCHKGDCCKKSCEGKSCHKGEGKKCHKAEGESKCGKH
jgi:peptidoglycan hydrolase CwlO-like protein